MNDTLASAPHQASAAGNARGLAEAPRRHYSLAILRSIITTWEERKRLRWELEQMSKDNPHLIDDIGLTRRRVEAEIAKPFWQV
jgi:uncharacterized protein YjiS (DUF1127 family)